MVIGVDLLSQFGKITMDFNDHTVQFSFKGNAVQLQGIQSDAAINLITKEQWDREIIKTGENWGAYLCIISGQQEKAAGSIVACLDFHILVEEFSVVFVVPIGLPPNRGTEHKITIKTNVEPIK